MAISYEYSNFDYLVKMQNLSIRQNDNLLFKNFNLIVNKNNITGIYAPTGSGKSTLLNLIAGLNISSDFYISGNIYINNSNKISYAFQEPRLIENISVFKNIMLPVEKMSISLNKISEILKFFDLENKQNQIVSKLSGGERQRVNIARAIIYPSNLVLLDEPFNSQDENRKIRLITKLKEIILYENKTCIIVSHNLDELKLFANHILTIKDFK